MAAVYRRSYLLCALSLALATAACGGGGGAAAGSSGGSGGSGVTSVPAAPAGPSSADVAAVQYAFLQSMVASSNSGYPKSSALRRESISQSGGCSVPPPGMTTSLCNIQFGGTDATGCTSGYNNVSGSITGSLNLSASGVSSLSLSFTVTPHCTIGAWSIGGNPYISFTGSYTSTASQTSLSGTGPSGGWSMTQNGVSANCLIVSPSSYNISGSHGYLNGSTTVCNGNSLTTQATSW